MLINYGTKFLSLPEFRVGNWQILETGHQFHVLKEASQAACPICGALTNKIHDRRRQMVRDLPIQDKPATLLLLKRRFRCRACDRVFPETYENLRPYSRRTKRFEELLFRQSRNPFKWVAEENRISPYVVANNFRLLAGRELSARKPTPITALGIDENGFRKGSRYNTVITNLLGDPKLVEILPGKSQRVLEKFFKNYPYCQLIQYVAMDMCPVFLRTVEAACPKAYVVADKFHVLAGITRILGKLRRKKFYRSLPVRITRGMLMKPYLCLNQPEKAVIDYLLQEKAGLAEVYWFKERFHRFYRLKDGQEARSELRELIGMAMQSEIRELRDYGRQLMRWDKYILNYFVFKITNARTEGINNKIKLIKRMSYGFRNFANFRLKALVCCA